MRRARSFGVLLFMMFCVVGVAAGAGKAGQCHLLDIGSNPADPNRALAPDECIVITDGVSPIMEISSGTPGVYGVGCLPAETAVVVGPDGLFRRVYICGNVPRTPLSWTPTGKKHCPAEPTVIPPAPCPACPPAFAVPCPEAYPCPPVPAPVLTPYKEKSKTWIAPVVVGGALVLRHLYFALHDGDDDNNDRHKKKCDPKVDGIDCDAHEHEHLSSRGFQIMIPIPLGRKQ